MKTRTCSQCRITKSLCEFPTPRKSLNFKEDKSVYAPCRACNASRARRWREKNQGYKGSGRILSVPIEDRLIMSMVRARLTEARSRVRKFNLPTPDLDDVYLLDLFKSQNGRCALLGHAMVVERKHPLCPSLDQIEPGKGYMRGNVQWVTWVANRAKGDLSADDFYQMCKLAIEHREAHKVDPS